MAKMQSASSRRRGEIEEEENEIDDYESINQSKIPERKQRNSKRKMALKTHQKEMSKK